MEPKPSVVLVFLKKIVHVEAVKLALGEQLIFPNFLQLNETSSIHVKGKVVDLYRPVKLDECLELSNYPDAVLVVANTSRVFECPKEGTVAISTAQVPELRDVQFS